MLNILTEIESGNIYFLACKFIYGSFVETDKEVSNINEEYNHQMLNIFTEIES